MRQRHNGINASGNPFKIFTVLQKEEREKEKEKKNPNRNIPDEFTRQVNDLIERRRKYVFFYAEPNDM